MTIMAIEQLEIKRKKRIINLISAIAILVAAAFFFYGIRTGLFRSHEAMVAFLEPFGLATPFIYIFFIALQSIFMVVPGALGNLVGVLLFGPAWGILCNYIGTVIGSSVNFFLARYYGPNIIRIFSTEKGFKKYNERLKHENLRFHTWFAILIFLPLAPDDLLCYMAGLTNMTFKKFITIILLGKPIAVAAYSLLLHYGFTNLLNYLGW